MRARLVGGVASAVVIGTGAVLGGQAVHAARRRDLPSVVGADASGVEGDPAHPLIRVCAVGDSSPDTALAHEFGHLLGLDHQGDIRDLMNPGLSPPGTPLTTSEIADARKSKLAKRFGARPPQDPG